jgi:hypothetical protein
MIGADVMIKIRRIGRKVILMISRNVRKLIAMVFILLFALAMVSPAMAQEDAAAAPDEQPIVVNVPEQDGGINPLIVVMGIGAVLLFGLERFAAQRREDKLLDRLSDIAAAMADNKGAKDNLEMALQSMPPSIIGLIQTFSNALLSLSGAGRSFGEFLHDASDGLPNEQEIDLPDGVTPEEAHRVAREAIAKLGQSRRLQTDTMKMPVAPPNV